LPADAKNEDGNEIWPIVDEKIMRLLKKCWEKEKKNGGGKVDRMFNNISSEQTHNRGGTASSSSMMPTKNDKKREKGKERARDDDLNCWKETYTQDGLKRTSTILMVMKDKTTATPQPSLRWSKLQVTISITRMVTGTRMSQKVCGVPHRPKILSSSSPYPKHEEKNKLPLNNKPTKARPPSITSLLMVQITGRRTLSSTGPLARLPLNALSTELQSLLLHCRSEKRPMSMSHLALSPVKRGANIPRSTIQTRRMPQPQRRLWLLQAVETVVNLAAEEELREKSPMEEREVQIWQHRHHRCSLH
jgi:hypothetical protein